MSEILYPTKFVIEPLFQLQTFNGQQVFNVKRITYPVLKLKNSS